MDDPSAVKHASGSETFDLPAELLAALEAAAREEDRPPRDVVREAVERYVDDREWRKLFALGERRAAALGLTDDDVPRLIAEARAEDRRGGG